MKFSIFEIFDKYTVETTRLAHPDLYYLPYKNGELEKIVLYSDHHSSMIWRLYEKDPTLQLYIMNLALI